MAMISDILSFRIGRTSVVHPRRRDSRVDLRFGRDYVLLLPNMNKNDINSAITIIFEVSIPSLQEGDMSKAEIFILVMQSEQNLIFFKMIHSV